MAMVNLKKTSPSQEQLNSLLEYYQHGLHDDAETLALSIAEKFPRHNFSWKVLAEILKKTDRTPEALVAGQKAIEIDPNYVAAYAGRGSAKEGLEDYYGAIAVSYTHLTLPTKRIV